MDFYVDLALAVLLRLLKDRRASSRYLGAIAKLYLAIERAAEADENLGKEIERRRGLP